MKRIVCLMVFCPLLACLGIAGCAGETASTAETSRTAAAPPAQELQLVAVEKLPMELLPNASFEEWMPGASAPAQSVIAPQVGSSLLEEVEVVADGKRAVRQRWTQVDLGAPPEQRFGVETAPLLPGQDYRISGQSRIVGGVPAMIEIYGVAPGQELRHLKTIGAPQEEGWQGWATVVNSGDFQRLRIVTRAPGQGAEFPMDMLWDHFQVQLEAPAPAAAP